MRLASFLVPFLLAAVELPPEIVFRPGFTNAVMIGNSTAVYRVPAGARNVNRVLLTHARRELISTGPAQAKFVVPAAERDLFENPMKFWAALETKRFHDYAQESTKVPIEAIPIERTVSDGDSLEAGSTVIRVIETPGYTNGAVSYLIEAGDKRIACTGDLIYGDGRILDLYSLQDAVPEAKARGYHGYAARAGNLIASLRKVAQAKPDVILPARGGPITDPQASINRLIARLQTFLASHFETDALRWYWGDENHRVRSRAVEQPMEIMPMAEQAKLPQDIIAIGNSRLIVSRTGAAFLVDAGYRDLLPELRELLANGKIKTLDGIWITHYHDDHTDYINDVTAEFGSPVYFTDRMAEVMEKPGTFRLPCLTTRPVEIKNAQKDGATLGWHEWQFTFWYFPGQTMYHGGLVARRDDGQTYLFVGDSFTPSGMDDYCMQNRDILRPGEGYEYCLRRIASLPKDTWLINQHVEPLFRYSAAQLTRMQRELEKRSAALKPLSIWPDINYMVDESWARIHPYSAEIDSGGTIELQLRIMNHAPDNVLYRVSWNIPAGWKLIKADRIVTVEARKEGAARAWLQTAGSGLNIITADIVFNGRELKRWTESLVRVR